MSYLGRMREGTRRLGQHAARTIPASRQARWLLVISVTGYLAIDLSGAGAEFIQFAANYPEYLIGDILIGIPVFGSCVLALAALRLRELRREAVGRKLADEHLARAEEITGIGSWEYDIATNRYAWSRQMFRLRGLPETFEPTSSAVAAYVHPKDEPELRQFRDDLKAGNTRDPIEVRVIHPDGRVRLLRYEGKPIVERDGAIRRAVGTARDITEQDLVQRQLAQAQKMELIGQLAGGIAHDFNNVLGIIIGNLEILEGHVAGDTVAEEVRRDALWGAMHGAELTLQLLSYARRQPLRPSETDLNERVRSTCRLLSRLLGEDIELDLQLDPAAWPVTVDPTQLEAALTNLASNARDAMSNGGTLTMATGNLRVSSRLKECADLGPGDYVRLEVSDTGLGIPADVIDQVFDPFFTTKGQARHSGLGLSMVLGFVQQSGGQVTVRSELEKGTTFSLYFPRSLVRERAEARRTALSAGRVEPGKLETVLLVEDDAKLRRSTVRHLVDLGYRVFEASDAKAAVVVLEINNAIDLLFSDVVMPGGMDGVDLVEWAVGRRPKPRCLLTSGFADLGDRKQRIAALGCKLLSKPYRRNELAAAIRDALDCAEA